jgi:hypothetical protein
MLRLTDEQFTQREGRISVLEKSDSGETAVECKLFSANFIAEIRRHNRSAATSNKFYLHNVSTTQSKDNQSGATS